MFFTMTVALFSLFAGAELTAHTRYLRVYNHDRFPIRLVVRTAPLADDLLPDAASFKAGRVVNAYSYVDLSVEQADQWICFLSDDGKAHGRVHFLRSHEQVATFARNGADELICSTRPYLFAGLMHTVRLFARGYYAGLTFDVGIFERNPQLEPIYFDEQGIRYAGIAAGMATWTVPAIMLASLMKKRS